MLARTLQSTTRKMSTVPLGRGHAIQVSQYTQSQVPDNVINLGVGQPGPSLLQASHELVTVAMEGLLKEGLDPFQLQYGAAAGYQDFRQVHTRVHMQLCFPADFPL
jgi:hypothetical protein